MAAVAHEARRLNAAAGHAGELAERHAGGSHARVFAVDDDQTVRLRNDAADAFKAAAGGHRVFENRIQRNLVDCALRRGGNGFVYGRVRAGALVGAAGFRNRAAGPGGI